MRPSAFRACSPFGLIAGVLVVGAGCQPAGHPGVRLSPSPKKESTAAESPPVHTSQLPPDAVWMEPSVRDMEPAVPIRFVHEETTPDEWSRLTQFWTLAEAPPGPEKPAALLGVAPLAVSAALAIATGKVVRIKVPLGLEDPGRFLPSSNPPTAGKWELGKRLFFDDTYLLSATLNRQQACASCHRPSRSFTGGSIQESRNTPTLINRVFGASQFWDGRAGTLEEIIQWSLADPRNSLIAARNHHAWDGVVSRLRDRPEYATRFRQVFGTPPTRDAVAKALATFMRTILAATTVHDLAERARKDRAGKDFDVSDYEKSLDSATLRGWGRDPSQKPEVARELLLGQRVFHGKARCHVCHGGRNFTDERFHNLGVGRTSQGGLPEDVGRFSVLSTGLKDWHTLGAFKTPTLRNLPQTVPYMHDGSFTDLTDVVEWHLQTANKPNPYLDAELRDPRKPGRARDWGLNEGDVPALVLFLKALESSPLNPVVADPDTWPEGTKPPAKGAAP